MNKEAIDGFLLDFSSISERLAKGAKLTLDLVHDTLTTKSNETPVMREKRCYRAYRACSFLEKNFDAFIFQGLIHQSPRGHKVHQSLIIALFLFFPVGTDLVTHEENPQVELVVNMANKFRNEK